jgi:hypothetical protein
LALARSGEFLPGWQGRFTLGATIEKWTDRSYGGWTGEFISAPTCERDVVDRVVFNVSAFGQWLDRLPTTLPVVIEIIQERYPSAREIVLQPIVGASPGQCLAVRDAQNHPTVVAALEEVVGGVVRAGPPPVVGNCLHFRDEIGHLTSVGARYLREQLRDYYRKEPTP